MPNFFYKFFPGFQNILQVFQSSHFKFKLKFMVRNCVKSHKNIQRYCKATLNLFFNKKFLMTTKFLNLYGRLFNKYYQCKNCFKNPDFPATPTPPHSPVISVFLGFISWFMMDMASCPPCGFALAVSRSCSVTSWMTSRRLCTSPFGIGTYSSASRSNSVANVSDLPVRCSIANAVKIILQ